MPRQIGRMPALAVARATVKGMYHDGGGLYLQVAASGAKSWIYRYMLNGRAREMGLGPFHIISLSEARSRAADCRRLRLDGIDPIEARKAKRDEAKLVAAKAITFDACAKARIEAILDWATVRAYRKGENPARWRGHLDKLLPARSKVRKIEHHAALPYNDIPAFMAELHEQEGIAARALEFLILTAARTGEVIGARWNEIDLKEKI